MQKALLSVAAGAIVAGAAAVVIVRLLAAWQREEHRQHLLKRERTRPARLRQSALNHPGDTAALRLVVSSAPN